MSVRKDTAQLIISIDTKESQAYAKTVADTKSLVKDLGKAKIGSEEYNAALQKIVESNKSLQGADFTRLTGRNLKLRRKQLFQLKDALTQTAFAEGGFEKELKDVNKALRDQGQRIRATEKRMGLFKRSIVSLGPAIAIAFSITAIKQFFTTLFNSTTELSAVENRFRTVFGNSASIVERFAKRNAIAMGLSIGEFKKAAASSGDLLKPLGFTEDAAAALTLELIKNSAAVSEFNGGQRTTAEVAQIQIKALLGEREQLKELGIAIQEADVKQKLAAKGQASLTGEALKQAKALATLELITESSTDALRSYEEGTNSMTRAKASLGARTRQLVEDLGEKLKPVFNLVLTAAEQLFKAFTDGVDPTTKLGVAVNTVKSIFEFSYFIYGLVRDGVKELFSELAKLGVEFPLFGNAFRLFSQSVANTSSYISGFGAAIKQMRFNTQINLAILTSKFEIFKLKAKKAINIFDDAEELRLDNQLKAQIDNLATLESVAEQNAASIQSAFNRGFINSIQDRIEKENKLKKQAADEQAAEELLLQQAKIDAERKLLKDQLAAKERVEAERIAKIKASRANDNIGPVESITSPISKGVSKDPETLEELANERLAKLQESSNREFIQLEINALRTLTTEELYEQQRLDKLVEYNERRLGILEAAGLKDTEIYEQIELEKLRIEKERQQKSIENEERTVKMKRELEIAQREATADTFTQFADLLSQDETARKKNAGAIKTFKSAEVIVSGINEVSRIREQAATLGPIFGPIIGAAQTALAVGRTVVSLGRIKNTKFEKGVQLKQGAIFRGALHSQGGIPFSHGEAEDGEIIINRRSSAIFRDQLEAINTYNGYGRKFSDGGTIASLPSVSPVGITPDTVSNSTNDRLESILKEVSYALRTFPRRAEVSLSQIQEKQNIENTLESLSGY